LMTLQGDWYNAGKQMPRQYVCGYCGSTVGPNLGYLFNPAAPSSGPEPAILICSYCQRPTYFEGDDRMPAAPIGVHVTLLPDSIEALYDEARLAGAMSPTAAVLAIRKILMHVAVEKGAKEGESFLSYVEFLADSGYVPPDGKGWVDHIRKKGNEANHEITLMSESDAEEMLTFVEMLLRFVYELPRRVPGVSVDES